MTVRSILAGTSGGPASAGAISLACQLANRFGSHIECYHARLDPKELLLATGYGDYGMLLDGAWIDQMEADSEEAAGRAKQAALDIIRQRGVDIADHPPHAGPSAAWFVEIGAATRLVARRARFFDLVVLGRSQRVVGEPHTDVIEQTLLRSGRPVLLAPAQESGNVADQVAIAWNGSTPAVRALAASMPFLALARKIVVLTIGESAEQGVGDLKSHLAWHGVSGQVRHAARGKGAIGDNLLNLCREEGASMLVMGGFSHTPWRETLLGGATHEVVTSMSVPVLLSH